MATNKMIEEPPFEYGASVQWEGPDRALYYGSICGFRVIDSTATAKSMNIPQGSILALVEKPDGSTVEILISKLEITP